MTTSVEDLTDDRELVDQTNLEPPPGEGKEPLSMSETGEETRREVKDILKKNKYCHY